MIINLQDLAVTVSIPETRPRGVFCVSPASFPHLEVGKWRSLKAAVSDPQRCVMYAKCKPGVVFIPLKLLTIDYSVHHLYSSVTEQLHAPPQKYTHVCSQQIPDLEVLLSRRSMNKTRVRRLSAGRADGLCSRMSLQQRWSLPATVSGSGFKEVWMPTAQRTLAFLLSTVSHTHTPKCPSLRLFTVSSL